MEDQLQQQVDPTPKEKLWKSLNDAKYYTKSFEEFNQQFSSPDKIDKLYGALSADKYYTKSVDDFKSQFFSEDLKKNALPQGLENGSTISTGQSQAFQAPTNTPTFAGDEVTIPATQLEEVQVTAPALNKTYPMLNGNMGYDAVLTKDQQAQAINTQYKDAEIAKKEPEEHWYNTFGAMLQAIPKSVYETVDKALQTESNKIGKSSVKPNEDKSSGNLAKDYFDGVFSFLTDNLDQEDVMSAMSGNSPAVFNKINEKIINSNISQEEKNKAIKEINKTRGNIQSRINMMDEYASRNPYPHNMLTNTGVGLAGILPDIAFANVGGKGATGEVLAGKVASAVQGAPAIVAKYAPKAAALLERAVTAPFTKVMAVKGAAEGGASNTDNPTIGMTTGALKGGLEGFYMHVLGEGAGKVNPYIAKVIGKTGATSEISTAIANPLANAGVFTLAKSIRTPLEEGRMATAEELEQEIGMGIGFSLLHAGQTFKTHKEANHFYENTLKTDPQESLGRVLNEKPENILRDYNTNLNVKDLTEARDELKEAIVKEPDLEVKKQLGDEALKIQNQLDAKEAVDGIVKDRDALMEVVDKLPELTPEQKSEYLAKIDQIANEFNPVEASKRDLSEQISQGEENIKQYEEMAKNALNPAERIENEVKAKQEQERVDKLNGELTKVVEEQLKPNKTTNEENNAVTEDKNNVQLDSKAEEDAYQEAVWEAERLGLTGQDKANLIEQRSKEFREANNEVAQEPQTTNVEVKKGSDVVVGDAVELVDGKKATVQSVEGNNITMELEDGTTLTANPKMVEIFKPTVNEKQQPTSEIINEETTTPTAEETVTTPREESLGNSEMGDIVEYSNKINPKSIFTSIFEKAKELGVKIKEENNKENPFAGNWNGEEIIINTAHQKASTSTLAHEALHAILHTQLRDYKNSELSKKLDVFKSDLFKRIDEIGVKNLNTDIRVRDFFLDYIKDKDRTNQEIVTFAFTERGFATLLDSIKIEGKKETSNTFWGRLKEIFANSLINNGIKTKYDELIEILDSENIFKNKKENVNTPNESKSKGETKADAEVVQSTENDGGGNGTENKGTTETETPKDVSGIKKKLVSDKIIESVEIDKISDKEMQDLGKSLIETGEINPKAIVDEIAGVKKSKGVVAVEGSKRALQPKEVVALIHYKATLDNQRRELLAESNKLASEGKSTATVDAELSRVMDDINAYDTMAVITAQQQSLAFRLRKGLLDKDYNLVTQIEQYKKVNGGEIPADVEARFKELDKELTELKEKIAEAEKRAQEAEEKKAIDNIVQDVERSYKTRKSSLTTEEQARKKQLAKKYRVFNDITRMVTLIAEKDFREYARLVLKEAKGDFQTFAVEILKTLGVDAKNLLPKLYTELGGKGKVDLDGLVQKPFVKDGQLVIPNNYIRDLVNEGVTDINDLSQKVLDVVQKDLPDATLREVRDAITKYGREVNQTADEVTRSINEAKRLGRLYSELEDLANQKKKAKTAKKAQEISTKEKELRRQAKLLEDRLPKTNEEIELAEEKRVKNAIAATERSIIDIEERIANGELEKEVNNIPLTPELLEARERLKEQQVKLRELQENAGIIEQRRTDNRKKQLEKFIKERQQRLVDKNFAPREKAKPIQEDAELQDLQIEANRVRNEYEEAHYENEQRNRPNSEKIKDAAIGWGTGIARALQAGLDASAFLVQGVMAISTQNPKRTWEAVKESAKFLVSEKYEKEYFNKLKSQDDFNEMKESGLALNYPNSKLGSRDYQLQGAEINKIWNFIVSPLKYTLGEKAYDRAKLFNPYRATERSFTGAIDTLRVQMFRELTSLLKQDGITFESNPELFKNTANVVNNMTFRGRLRNLEPIAKELSVVFFAPSKIAASLALTNPYYWGDLAVKNPIVAKRAMLKMATFIGVATTLTLAHMAWNDDEENKDIFNPLSPDFMKLKIGNTRIDFFGGLNQNVILFARMFTGLYKTSTSSKISKLGENSFVPTRAELGARFLTNKFAPTSALAYRWLSQGSGRQVEWDDEAIKSIQPIWAQNIKELYNEHPVEMASFLTAMAFFGQNMSTYGGADFLEKGKDDKVKELFDKKGASFSDKTRSSIEVIDSKTVEKRGISKAEFDDYKKVYGDYIKQEVKSRYKELEDMAVDKFEAEMKKIKSRATTLAKDKISGFDADMLEIRDDGKVYELTANDLKKRLDFAKEFDKEYPDELKEITDDYIADGMSSAEAAIKARKEYKSLVNAYTKNKMLDLNDDGKIKLKEKE